VADIFISYASPDREAPAVSVPPDGPALLLQSVGAVIPLNASAVEAAARMFERADLLGHTEPEHYLWPACQWGQILTSNLTRLSAGRTGFGVIRCGAS